MKKRIFALFWAVILAVLPGCSLARSGQGSDPAEDRLVGFFASAQLLETPVDFRNGTVVFDGVAEAAVTYAPDGTAAYSFPGIEGILLYSIPVTVGEGRSYERSRDDRIITSQTGVGLGDGGEAMTFACELAVAADSEEVTLWCNPLYLRADGSLYAKAATGWVIDPRVNGEGGSLFFSHDSGYSGEEWKEAGWSSKVTLSYEIVPRPEGYAFCQMDGDNREIARTEYLPGDTPETLALDCAWLLVEERARLADGSPVVLRRAYGPQDGSLYTLAAEASGLCARRDTALVWE